MAKSLHENVEVDFQFYLADGRVLKNLKELHKSLLTMSEEVYDHHVGEAHNDFYNWINDVYENKGLAKHVAQATGSKEAAKVLKVVLDVAAPPKKKAKAKKAAPKKAKATKKAPKKKKTTKKKSKRKKSALSKFLGVW